MPDNISDINTQTLYSNFILDNSDTGAKYYNGLLFGTNQYRYAIIDGTVQLKHNNFPAWCEVATIADIQDAMSGDEGLLNDIFEYTDVTRTELNTWEYSYNYLYGSTTVWTTNDTSHTVNIIYNIVDNYYTRNIEITNNYWTFFEENTYTYYSYIAETEYVYASEDDVTYDYLYNTKYDNYYNYYNNYDVVTTVVADTTELSEIFDSSTVTYQYSVYDYTSEIVSSTTELSIYYTEIVTNIEENTYHLYNDAISEVNVKTSENIASEVSVGEWTYTDGGVVGSSVEVEYYYIGYTNSIIYGTFTTTEIDFYYWYYIIDNSGTLLLSVDEYEGSRFEAVDFSSVLGGVRGTVSADATNCTDLYTAYSAIIDSWIDSFLS